MSKDKDLCVKSEFLEYLCHLYFSSFEFQNHYRYLYRCHCLGNDFSGYKNRGRNCSALVCSRIASTFSVIDFVANSTFHQKPKMDWMEKLPNSTHFVSFTFDWSKWFDNCCRKEFDQQFGFINQCTFSRLHLHRKYDYRDGKIYYQNFDWSVDGLFWCCFYILGRFERIGRPRLQKRNDRDDFSTSLLGEWYNIHKKATSQKQ